VSAGVAHLFSQYAGGAQALAGKASVFHEQFVQQLKAGAGSYASIEAANAALLGPLNAGARSSASAIAALSGPSLLSLLTDAGAAVSQLLILLTNVLNGFVLSISLQRLLANILSGVVEYALIISGVLGILTRL
jgi:hypothetical protein